MKAFDITVAILLVVGGLNLGCMGIFGFNPIEYVFDEVMISRLLYTFVGVGAGYQAFFWKSIQKRWKVVHLC